METMEVIISILTLLGGVGAFLLGFKVLSENIEKLASGSLKRLFNKISKNRFIGVAIGALVTTIIQSSSATTVMIVGFVNAGIMNLFQATAMIMGANIGTTITAHIISLKELPISEVAFALAFVGIFMDMLSKKDKVKTSGLAITGLGLVFIALEFMSSAMDEFAKAGYIETILTSVNNPFLLLLLGALITAIVQSSSAVTGIIILMVGSIVESGGIIEGNALLFVILGTNIGTCITAILSSVGASVNARRASLIHLMFNVFGSIIFTVILLLWSSFMEDILMKWFNNATTQIAMFHTFFNVLTTIVFIPFINVFVKISQIIIKDKKEEQKTTYLDDRFLKTAGVAINQTVKETVLLGEIAMSTLDLAVTKFVERSRSAEAIIQEKINDIEIINREIVAYLVKVSAQEVSMKDENLISALHHTINDFIRVGEIADNMMKYTRSVIDNGIEFSDSVIESIKKLQEMLKEQFNNIKEIMLNARFELLPNIKILEDDIDRMRNELIDGHIKRLEEGKCKPQSSGVFINLISNLERAGDHLDYVADIMAGVRQ